MFSKACEYGIKAAIFIAQDTMQQKRVSLKDIANAIDSPEAFTGKILQKLVKHDIITSMRGAKGGFEVNLATLDQIKLKQIVYAIDGDALYTNCALGFSECSSEKPCAMHFQFMDVRENLNNLLEHTTLEELVLGVKDKLAFLKE
ncbi:RrF2 family transcriptional regulator [Haloflavibacter putidus]|uniref:Rrf2 family transcriptional regulator n=1 Tax=Haloflavibacter putidus TaxID=2576776 RepID=A0A507ZRX5_9FLAO|nr:Rrf2 family transcriptional regulator [Haloflavibacter putidus]TQD39757.1 Rrf2 family transcriptional regulator [Haloflavibacter putidus]